ncbi:DUF222 domain-containing protein [Leucobacter weissii]|uniref:DUF222 domain-containing protein n=1 Tax=Leucobacter weissii TaxID=1983706 RepID=A0A939MQA3_9MICO|nr:HNH endonuclease signature motif containing protein [Leucobacter weissii]MBO1902737.1 DUF222 domain-containing protein [Leucobacter weissii]
MTEQHDPASSAAAAVDPGAWAAGEDPAAQAPGALPSPPHEEILVWLERVEMQQRGLDATRLALMAAALDQVADPSGSDADTTTGAAGRVDGRGRELAYRSLRAELAVAFQLSEHQTESQLDLAYQLTHRYPSVFRALEGGEIARRHASVIVDASTVIGVDEAPETLRRRAGYAGEVLGYAVAETPNRLRPIARRLAEQWAQRPLEERYRDARAQRRVYVVDREDGMADLIAHLPAIEAYAIRDRLTRIAIHARHGTRRVPERHQQAPGAADGDGEDAAGSGGAGGTGGCDAGSHGFGDGGADRGESRTRDQLRTDVFADLLLAADEHTLLAGSTAEAVHARVQVLVPAAALPRLTRAETSSDPNAIVCELSGYGPISMRTDQAGNTTDGSTASDGIMAEAGTWEVVTTHPDTAEVLSVDRYRPSEQIRRRLGIRDRRCRFPGCRVPVQRCDLDHTVDAAHGGPTSTFNLAHLCRGHHTLKHHSDWAVTQETGGVLRWRSPTGREYLDRPPGAPPPTARAPGAVRFTRSPAQAPPE